MTSTWYKVDELVAYQAFLGVRFNTHTGTPDHSPFLQLLEHMIVAWQQLQWTTSIHSIHIVYMVLTTQC